MVSHDFGRRTIRGLPPGASSALRGGGSLEAAGVHRSIADVWRSVLAPGVHTPLPAMSAAEVRQHFGRGVLSDARPADGELFGGEVKFDLGGMKELEPEDTSAADYFGSIDCSCNDGSIKVGDACGEGGEVSAVSKFGFIGSAGLPGYQCAASVTCRNGNGCQCNEKLLHPGNRTCDEHGYSWLDPEFRCEFNGQTCTCYVHCKDGTWVENAGGNYPRCEADGSETTMVHFEDTCWRPKVEMAGPGGGVREVFDRAVDADRAPSGCSVTFGTSEYLSSGQAHSYLVVQDSAGVRSIVQAGPAGNCYVNKCGRLVLSPIGPPPPDRLGSLLLADGAGACGQVATILAEAGNLDGHFWYRPWACNSNTFVSILLELAGISYAGPPDIIGWDKNGCRG